MLRDHLKELKLQNAVLLKAGAVGHRGLILVWNGDAWDVSDSGTRYPLKKIVWDGKVFVVLSEAGMLLSSDGLVWSAVK